MAIKINNTTVIDDSRNLTNVNTIVAGSPATAGTAGQFLASTGTGIQWLTGSTTVEFASSGNFVKANYPGAQIIYVLLWAGGGSGNRSPGPSGAVGGGGGACANGFFPIPSLPPSVPISIGAGGAGVASPLFASNPGGNSTFGDLLTSYGGRGAWPPSNNSGGDGGGLLGPTYEGYDSPVPGLPPTVPAGQSQYGGATGGGAGGNDSAKDETVAGGGYFGGGGGGSVLRRNGGNSYWGGAGGVSSPSAVTPVSKYGGNGGTTPSPAGQPKGGGGAGVNPGTPLSGAGGPGHCTIYVY